MRYLFTTLVALFALAFTVNAQTISFGSSGLNGANPINPTSLQFGPDGRLYVSEQKGKIWIYTIVRDSSNYYRVVDSEQLFDVQALPNHDDDGTLNTSENTRQITGILVAGTATNPIIYVSSSDPRIGGGGDGIANDKNLDTNSGTVSRLRWNGTSWEHVILVQGLPRSEENHSVNGMQLDTLTNTLYLAVGGNTNMGAPSNNFIFLPEYALSAAILSIDLDAIGDSLYNIPTLDDEDRPGVNDANDPFGGNSGKNQARLISGGPIQVYGSGFRNPYDLVLTSDGKIYSFDNGPNGGWGGPPATCSNDTSEPGSTYCDNLHLVTPGYYAGHPNPTRANSSITFNASNPQSPVDPGLEDPNCTFQIPGVSDGAITTVCSSTNGICEYTASNFGGAIQGDLLAAAFNGNIYRFKLNATGDAMAPGGQTIFASGFGSLPLDVISVGDEGDFAGTVWAATYGAHSITIFEPLDYISCTGDSTSFTEDDDYDGYSNGDELANGTDRCSPASKPADYDGDFLSDIIDPDDDNDGISDTTDIFALDSLNGFNTTVPITYEFDNSDDGGIQGWGFTGVMTNGLVDYMDTYDPDQMTVGGAALKFTIDSVPGTTAYSTVNDQTYAMHFGIDLRNIPGPYAAHSRIVGPFGGFTPSDFQQIGMYVGTGDQSNYISIVCDANGGAGGIRVTYEENDGGFGGLGMPVQNVYNIDSVLGSSFVDLYIAVDPFALTAQPSFRVDGGPRIDLGTPFTIPAGWVDTTMAVGIISSSYLATPFAATWENIEVILEPISVAGDWVPIPSPVLPTNRHESSYVQAGDKFYMLGGRGIKPVNIFDPIDSTWSAGTSPPIEMHHFQAVEYDGLIYVVGAFTGFFPNETPIDSVYIYDPVNDSWTTAMEIPASRRRGSASAVVYNDKIYLANGILNGHVSGWVNWTDAFDPSTNTWEVLPNSPHARDHFHAAVVGDQMVVAGGRQSGGSGTFAPLVPETDIFDLSTESWTTLPSPAGDLPTPRAGTAMGVIGDEIIVVGGESMAQLVAHNEAEALNLTNLTWRSLDTLITGRHGTQVISNNNGLYIAAGSGSRGGSPELSDQEAFYFYGPTEPSLNSITKGNLTATPSSYDFNTVLIGESDTVNIQLRNTGGNQGILINNLYLNDSSAFSFSIPYTLPIALPPGQTLTVPVVYTPSASAGDAASLIATHSGTAGTTIVPILGNGAQPTSAIRINCGGPQYISAVGDTFIADNFFTGGSTSGTGSAIANTLDDNLYRSERWGNPYSYNVPVSNGEYDVKLHMAEIYSAAFSSGSRLINIDIEGVRVLSNFDIYDSVGANAAVIFTFPTIVTDSFVTIDVSASVNNGKLSAIEVLSSNTVPEGALSAAPTSLHFFSTVEGTASAPQMVELTNMGDTALTILSGYMAGAASGQFNYSLSAPTTLAPGEKDTAYVTFFPASYGLKSAELEVTHTGVNSPLIIPLTGEGASASTTDGSLRINCGGPQYLSVSGDTFIADKFYYPLTAGFYVNNAIPDILGTADDVLYRTERNDDFGYNIPVPADSNYLVILHFAEIYHQATGGGGGGVGSRIMDVAIEGALFKDNLDIFAEVGTETALVFQDTVLVLDDTLDIDLIQLVGDAKISAIEVIPIDANTAPFFTLSGDINENEDFAGSRTVTASLTPTLASDAGQTVTYSMSPATLSFADISINPTNGTVTATAVADSSGTATITVTADDGQASNNLYSQTFDITISPVNDKPVAVDDSDITSEDVAVNVNVLANDSDADGDALSAALVVGALNGTAVVQGDNSITYTPALDYNGPDSFAYSACDGSLCDTAWVVINVGAANDAPIANNDSLNINEDNSAVFSVAINDSDTEPGILTFNLISPAGNGIAVVGGSGSATYVPNANYFGSDQFTYSVCDGGGLCDTATVYITINPVNDQPTAVDDAFSTNEDVLGNVTLSTNDSDVEAGPLSWSLVTPAANGSAFVNATGTASYIGNLNFNGIDSFAYQVCDGGGLCDTAWAVVTVNPVNDAPTAVNDAAGTMEDVALTIDVQNNDSDIDGDSFTTAIVSGAANGSLLVLASDSILYTPNTNYNGSDVFFYSICDGGGACDTAQVNISIASVNDKPIAINDYATTPEDTAVTIDLTANDFDVESGSLTTTLVTPAGNGTASVLPSSPATYTPALHFNGVDSFSYRACDGGGLCDTAWVYITVTGVNNAPVAVNDMLTTDEDVSAVADVQGNDSDVDGGLLTTSIISGPANGSAMVLSGDSIMYSPNADYCGADALTYSICDAGGLCDTATLNITVNCINDAPVAVNDTLSTTEDVAANLFVSTNDYDVDMTPLTYTLISPASNGTATVFAGGFSSYNPTANYNGSDSYTYSMCDGSGACDTATVYVTVSPANDAPVAVADNYTMPEDSNIIFNVLTNDSDIDGDPLSASLLSGPSNGGAIVLSNGVSTYAPSPNYNGSDAFTYVVCDTAGLCDTATVTITITPVNDAPEANNDTLVVIEDSGLNTLNVRANDFDVEGAPYTYQITAAGNGVSSIGLLTGVLSYTPAADYNGSDMVTYSLCDTSGATVGFPSYCDTATVYIIVLPAGDAPVANNQNVVTAEDSTITFMANISDPDGDPLTGSILSGPFNGMATYNADSSITYTPSADYFGVDSFYYSICDTSGLCDTALVHVTILPRNDTPVAINDTLSTMEDMSLALNVQANDYDVDGGAPNATVIVSPANGSLPSFFVSGVGAYQPNADFNGVDSFAYSLCDFEGACDTAWVYMAVSPVNDAPVALSDTIYTDEDMSVVFDVTANDSDVDGDALTATALSSTSNGTLVFGSGIAVDYTPNANYFGPDQFQYYTCDGNGLCDTTTVYIIVNSVNDAPIAVDDADSAISTLTTAITPLDNDSDVESLDATSLSIISGPSNGSYTLSGDSVLYTSNPGYFGPDTMVYAICDTGMPVLCDTALIVIEVYSGNHAPIAVNDLDTTNMDTPLYFDPTANDSDPDGDGLTVTYLCSPIFGTAGIDLSGNVVYTPPTGFTGIDVFCYVVCDDGLPSYCDTATITIRTIDFNEPPIAVDDSAYTNEDEAIAISVLSNDIDDNISGSGLTISTAAANGTAVKSGAIINYTPNPDFFGLDSFEYRICDAGSPVYCDFAWVYVFVDPVNDAPVAMLDIDTVIQGDTLVTDVLFNDFDIDGPGLETSIIGGPFNGTASVVSFDSIQYIHNDGYLGYDTVHYQVCDTEVPALCDTSMLIIWVTEPVGIGPEPVADMQLSIYPNPNEGQFVLSATVISGQTYQLRMFNAIGELMWAESLEATSPELEHAIDLALPAGYYMLELSNADGSATQRVLIQK